MDWIEPESFELPCPDGADIFIRCEAPKGLEPAGEIVCRDHPTARLFKRYRYGARAQALGIHSRNLRSLVRGSRLPFVSPGTQIIGAQALIR